MTGDPTAGEALAAAQRALARVRSLRERGVPFDPLSEIASLRAALAGERSELGEVTAAELEVSCTRVELAWTELDMRRAAIAFQVLTLRRHRQQTSPSLVTAEEFLRTWNSAFGDVLSIESRVWLARRLEVRLAEEVASVTGDAPAVSASPPIEAAGARRERLSSRAEPTKARGATATTTPLFPLTRWIRSPSGLTCLLLVGFVIVGAYDRIHGLGALSLWNDEAQSTLISFTIVQHGYPIIHAQHLINNYEPLYPYFEAVSVVVLGHSNFAYRLPAALFGIGLIPISYYVGSRLRDRFVGVALAAMMTFSSEFIAWSRQARWYILLVLLLALSLLVVIAWTRTTDRRRRLGLSLALLALFALSALTSIGLFLLYVPAILAGAVVFFVATKWGPLRRFFGVPPVVEGPPPPARFVPYWIRQLVAILLPALVILGALTDPALVGRILSAVLSKGVGFTPYPLVWSPNFGEYLVQFYLGVLVLVALGAVAILWRRNPVELALLTFCGAGFVSVSSLASLTNNIAGGNTSFERHIVPLLFFLFLVAAIAIVELARLLVAVVARAGVRVPRARAARPFVFGLLVVLIVVVPSVAVPSGQYVHQQPGLYPNNLVVPWVPFSFDPSQPSAVYQADQANYQLGAEYVAAHRNATDVIAATNPGAPQVYLGQVQYWVRGNALNNTVLTVDGQPEFFQTGSILLDSAAQLESMMLNHTGWLISDVFKGRGQLFPGGMDIVLADLMLRDRNVTDQTIAVYQWQQWTPLGVVTTLVGDNKTLHRFTTSETALINWAAFNGTTWSELRPLLLPLEPWLIVHVQPNLKGLAVLLSVYNERSDLQSRFPLVLATPPGQSDAALLHWAQEVVDGKVGDISQPTLEPYKSYFDANG